MILQIISVNRSHVYIGFAGLFVGSGVGFLIGISVKPSAITVTHMKAASATSYNGTEVIIYMCYYSKRAQRTWVIAYFAVLKNGKYY